MINEEKVKIMTKLAMYEQGKGRKYLPVSKYYRSDYIGLALIKNFFLVTIGLLSDRCSCSGLFWRISSGEYTQNESDNARCIYCDRLSDRTCGIFSPDVYTVLGSVLSGKKSVREYYSQLTELNKIYAREEKKSSGRGNAGGYRK